MCERRYHIKDASFLHDLIWFLLCVCVCAPPFLPVIKTCEDCCLLKKTDQLAMNEAVKNLKLIIVECEFPRMAA